MSGTLKSVPGRHFVIFSEAEEPVPVDRAARILRKHPRLRRMLEQRWERVASNAGSEDSADKEAKVVALVEMWRLAELQQFFSEAEWPTLYRAHERFVLSTDKPLFTIANADEILTRIAAGSPKKD